MLVIICASTTTITSSTTTSGSESGILGDGTELVEGDIPSLEDGLATRCGKDDTELGDNPTFINFIQSTCTCISFTIVCSNGKSVKKNPGFNFLIIVHYCSIVRYILRH